MKKIVFSVLDEKQVEKILDYISNNFVSISIHAEYNPVEESYKITLVSKDELDAEMMFYLGFQIGKLIMS